MAYFSDQFYYLCTGTEYTALSQYIQEYPEGIDEDQRWRFACDLRNGRIKPDRPVICGYSEGTRPTDFMSSTATMLISDRVIDVLTQNHFTGWSTFSVKVHDKKGNEIPGYHGLVVMGKCGPIDDRKSAWITRKANVGDMQVKVRYGCYFGRDSWDGSDVFTPKGTIMTFVTEPVKEALEKAHLTNIQLIKTTELERMW
ncbi:MAG: hypothetical protein HYV33_05125 [Candidatus Kerfeldbacteria bacterium]|nr:hypothetical protein [Candidatus Kerfeldbacteria bacterium]